MQQVQEGGHEAQKDVQVEKNTYLRMETMLNKANKTTDINTVSIKM